MRIIGNLPYNISTPLIFHLLKFGERIQDMCIMLQKEVALRIDAKPCSKQYGRLSVMVQQRCAVERVLSVAPGAFSPPPKVESAVIRLTPYRVQFYPLPDAVRFERIVRTAFNNRRKTIKNALQPLLDEAQICAAGIDPRRRPEQLTVGEYVRLAAESIYVAPTTVSSHP